MAAWKYLTVITLYVVGLLEFALRLLFVVVLLVMLIVPLCIPLIMFLDHGMKLSQLLLDLLKPAGWQLAEEILKDTR